MSVLTHVSVLTHTHTRVCVCVCAWWDHARVTAHVSRVDEVRVADEL